MRIPPDRDFTAANPPASPVAAVIAQMEHLSARLPLGDGVRAFNEMYLMTTQQVDRCIAGMTFADTEFMQRLDVVFAGLYLNALDRYGSDPATVPRCWRALFEARSRQGVGQLRFAIAGMNAHINHDLALALVQTMREFGGQMDDSSPRRADFLAINSVLARTQPLVRQQLLTGPLAVVDDALGQVDDEVSMWGIERAREFAWATGQALMTVQGTPAEGAFRAALDRSVALTSTLLLCPTP